MDNLMNMSMKLSSSFCITETVGDWKNYYTNNNIKNENYILTYLIDYQHLFFHISIAIENIDQDFSSEIFSIMNKTKKAIIDIQNSKLNGKTLHFTGKIFIITNTKNIDFTDLTDRFSQKSLSLTIYNIEEENLKIISPIISYTPVEEYTKVRQRGEEKVVFSSPNYTITESDDGGVSYSLHVMIDKNNTQKYLEELSELSPYRYKLNRLLHNTKLKKEYANVFSSAIKDVFENNLESAKQILQINHDKLYKKSILKNSLIAFATSIIFISILFLILHKLSICNQLEMSILLSTLGSFISFYIPLQYIKNSGYDQWYEFIFETIIRLFIGVFSGIILYLVVKSNFLLGMLNDNINAYYLIALISGWSEKLIPKILSNVEKKISEENK